MSKKKTSTEEVTAIIYSEGTDYLPKFFVVDGDQRKFNDVTINVDEDDKELIAFMFDPDSGEELHKPVKLDKFVEAVRAGAHVISCGFAP